MKVVFFKLLDYSKRSGLRGGGENVGVENAIQSKMHGWKMREYRWLG